MCVKCYMCMFVCDYVRVRGLLGVWVGGENGVKNCEVLDDIHVQYITFRFTNIYFMR